MNEPAMNERTSLAQESAAARISVDEFAEATFKAVLQAIEARRLQSPEDRILFPGPLAYGIIWWPEGMQQPGVLVGPQSPTEG